MVVFLKIKIMNWILEPIYYTVILAMAVSVISLTITKTKVFKSLRTSIKEKNEFFGELFSCPYCFSFYPSFLIQFLFYGKLRLTYAWSFILMGVDVHPIDFIVSWFVMVCIASFFTGWIYRSISQIE